MKPKLYRKRAEGLWFIVIAFLAMSLLWADPGWGDSGLSLNIYTLDESHKHAMDQPIPIIGVIKNDKKWPINTDLDFSQVELEQYLIATDPQGVKHTVPFQETRASEMPPPSKWGEWETVPAEVLPAGWQRSVRVDDLRELFPVIKRLSGWYTLEAHLPFSRYGWTIKDAGSNRLMGVLDNKAWHGTIKSKKLRIFVAPGQLGGRLKIRVEDLSTPESTARSHVNIRIFRGSEVLEAGGLADAWAHLDAIAGGNTGQGGWVTLPSGASCLPEPEPGDAYVAVAEYSGEYKAAYFEQGSEDWSVACEGLLTRYILFNEPTHRFSVFGLNSVWIRNKARIESGDVGAQKASDGPWLVPEFEIALGENVWVADGLEIKGDSVQIRSTASVYKVVCNDLANSGTIRGEAEFVLDCPVWDNVEGLFPADRIFQGDKNDMALTVESDKVVTLPGNPETYEYSNVILASNATLRLDGGTYDFMSLELGSGSRIVCNEATIIRISERLYPGTKAYIGPATESGLNADQIKIFVNGINGKKGGLNDKPWAAEIGEGNTIRANIFVKNGTLMTGEGCVLEGSFIAKDVVIGMKTIVNFNGGFE